MKQYWFYLSCAQADWEPYLEKFHHDLTRSLCRKAGLPETDIGYFGINTLEMGADGVQSLITALNNSRILIPLLTPAYFLSDICAKEWQTFRLREKALMKSLGPGVRYGSSIMPIAWDSARTLPPPPQAIVSELRYQSDEFGDKYLSEGLRQLVALDSCRVEYDEFLSKFTDKLYQVATAQELPPLENIPPITEIESSFSDSYFQEPISQTVNPTGDQVTQKTVQSPPIEQVPAVALSEASQQEKSKIFISYRRNDSEGFAGRLFDQLSGHFGEDQIFMDLDTIEAGEDFIEVIEKAVSVCHIMVAIIGKGWLTCKDSEGRRRLDNPEDFVRVEISTALEREIRVIPVLVQGAAIPRSHQLPDALAKLARRNAFELSSTRWKYDVGRLIAVIEKVLGNSGPLDDDRL